MRSLRSRLMIGSAVATLAVLAAAGIALFVLTRAALLRDFDVTTLAKARTIASMTEVDGERVNIEGLDQFPEFHRAKHPEFFEIWAGDGTVVFRSPSLKDRDLPRPAATDVESAKGRSVTLPDSRAGRELGIGFPAHADEDSKVAAKFSTGLMLVMARDTDSVDDLMADFSGLLALVCGVAVIVMLVVIALVIRRGLRPVNDLAGEIARIGETNLSAKLSDANTPGELAPIAARLNDLLGRLSAAFEREKSFTADAAHELRTPLAGLEAALEVCLRKPRDGARYEKVLGDCLGVVKQMHSMVDGLLLLARSDAKLVKVSHSTVAVSELLWQTWLPFADRAAERKLQVEWRLQENLSLETDREKLVSMVTNLFDNAVHYTDEGGRIEIVAGERLGEIQLRLANSGSRVSAGDARRVFDRFWRADPARSEAGTNCGLGLAVCQKLIAMMGGKIRVESSLGGQFVVELVLPADQTATSPEALAQQRIDFRGADKIVD